MKSCTVSKERSGRYFISILCEIDEPELKTMTGNEVGIDLGIKDLMIMSTGHKAHQLDTKTKVEKLKQLQRMHARTQKGSANREKLRVRIAKKHAEITDARNWYYHNLSRWLVDNFDSIYLEDLNVAGMIKNRKLSRSIHQASWSSLVRMIEYKSADAGRNFHKIDRWFPSSKTCSCCGYKNTELKLSDRSWKCTDCGTEHDRDFNAADNILKQGQIDCYNTPLETHGEEVMLPKPLMKMISKTERSSTEVGVNHGIEVAKFYRHGGRIIYNKNDSLLRRV